MIVTRRIFEVRKLVGEARAEGMRVGFVPTMGALHEGHLSLVRRAREECDYVVVSIFVNPTQFGAGEDLDNYPRTLADDLDACKSEGADLVFNPDPAEIYPSETGGNTAPPVDPPAASPLTAPPVLTSVVVRGMGEDRMEGAERPTHFDGVTLVCCKLFNIIGECSAYFGAKDAQQLRLVKRMAADLNMPVEVVACATVREPDGLALSSRNVYLSKDERKRALVLSRALFKMEELASTGEKDAARLIEAGREVLAEGRPDAIDYLEIVDPDTLEVVDRVRGEALVCGAIRFGGTRLLDNVILKGEQ